MGASSLEQQRLWVLNQLEPGNAADVVLSGWELDDAAELDLLAEAARRLGRDHEMLRTVLRSTDGQVRRLVLDPSPDVVITSLVARSIDEVVDAELGVGFDLEAGPLWRISVARLADDRRVLVVAMHAAIADQRSADLVARQLIESSRPTGTSRTVDASADEFAELVRREGVRDEATEQLLDRWRSLAASRPPVIDLPSDLPRPRRPGHRTRQVPLALDAALLARLEVLAGSCGTTVDVVLLTAGALTVRAFSQRDDFVLGVGRDNRPVGAERALGPFTDIRPLAVSLVDAPRLRDHVAQLGDRLCEGVTIPLARLVDELDVARDPDRHPLVQVGFSFLRRDFGLRCAPVFSAVGSSRLDLEFVVEILADGPRALLCSAVDVVDAATTAAMAGTFDRITAALAGAPDTELSYVDDRDVTRAPEPATTTVANLIDARAHTVPDAVAVRHGAINWTYRQLVDRSDAMADALVAAGVGPGDRVVVHGRRRPELIATYLAAFRIGATYVPIGTDMPRTRLAGILADAAPKAVCTDQPDPPPGPWRVLPLDVDGVGSAREDRSAPGNVAYVCYTSGSTGAPKGVAIGHAALTHLVDWHLATYRLGPSDVVSWATGIGFDASIGDLWPSLVAGAAIVLPPDEMLRLQPDAFAGWLDESGVTVCFLASPLAEAFLDNTGPNRVPRLRYLLTGGDRFGRRPSPAAPYQVVNQYGPTENTVWSTFSVVSAAGEGAPTIGTAIPNVTVHVLDSRRRPLPRGAFGELYLGGPQVALGYLNRPELTAERFVPDPFAADPDARMYRTGDIVRWTASDELQFLGRSDGQVKIRGVRIEPAEVEVVLLSHPAVREAAVVARPSRTGQLELVAHVVPVALGVDLADLATLVKQSLPQAFWPAAYLVTERFPLSANGKLDRTALAARPLPEQPRGESTRPPEGPVEELIGRVWTKVLNREGIGAEENFFALGGDSLLAIQVVSRLAGEGVRVRLIDVFDQPTVAELAAVVPRGEAIPVTPLMRSTGAALAAGAPVRGRAHVLRVPVDLDLDEIERSARRLVARHDRLRLRYDADAASAIVCDEGAVHVETGDDETVTVAEHAARLWSAVARPDGAALAMAYLPATKQLVVVGHPLCVDPESWPVLLAELSGATCEAAAGTPWLADANAVYRTTTVELLAAAAVVAVGETRGWTEIAMDVDCDGRAAGDPAVGLSTVRRTVVLPVGTDVRGVIAAVKNALRSPGTGDPLAGKPSLRLAYHDPRWTELAPGWTQVREIALPGSETHDLTVEVTPGERGSVLAAEGEPGPGQVVPGEPGPIVGSGRFEDAYRRALAAVLDHCSGVSPGQFTASDFPLFALAKAKASGPRRSA